MALIDDVKVALRVSGTALDSEILTLIDAAKLDIWLSGVATVEDTDALIKTAIIAYCKWMFGWDNPEKEDFQNQYELIVSKLKRTTAYGVT